MARPARSRPHPAPGSDGPSRPVQPLSARLHPAGSASPRAAVAAAPAGCRSRLVRSPPHRGARLGRLPSDRARRL